MASTKNEGQDDEKKEQPLFKSGYIKMTQSNADPKIYWAEFRMKANQLHLFQTEASIKDPEEIIYLSTCNVEETESQKKYIILNDECTGIRYKFEPHQAQNNPQGWINKINFFIQECIVDIIQQDPSQMNARQQFNRFLLYQKKMARLQCQQIPKIEKAVKKAEGCDEALKKHTNWLQRQKLDQDDRKKFGSALSVRNKFWNLLIETRDFLNDDYVMVSKICSVFTRWEKMSTKQEKLSDRDRKILVWGLTELTKFTANEKINKAQDLKKKWKELDSQIIKCQEDLQALQKKWEEKVEFAENLAFVLNILGGFCIAVGLAVGVVAACVAAPAIAAGGLAAAPAWLPAAAGGAAAAMLGGGVMMAGGQMNLNAHKGIKNTIEDMQKHMKSFEDAVQDWVEAIKLLDFPLGSIAFGGTDKEDYQQEIDGWEKIAEHEKELLKTAAKTFTVFRDQSLESLNRIRNVQRKLQL